MELTLRQARGLENRLRNLSIDNQIITIRAYDASIARLDIEEGVQDLEMEVQEKRHLNKIRHSIKNKLNIKNMECGVSALLNQRDAISTERELLSTLTAGDNVERQLSNINPDVDVSARVSTCTEEFEEDVLEIMEDLDVEARRISRELNELNTTVTIELDEDELETLRGNGFIQ